MDIRLATKEDSTQVIFLWKKYLEETLKSGGVVLANDSNLGFFKRLFLWYASDPGAGCTYLAWDKKIPLGVLIWGSAAGPGLQTKQGNVAIGWGSYVVLDWRRKGIASALRKQAAAYLASAGYDILSGSVDSSNAASVKSVFALGFETTSTNVVLKLR